MPTPEAQRPSVGTDTPSAAAAPRGREPSWGPSCPWGGTARGTRPSLPQGSWVPSGRAPPAEQQGADARRGLDPSPSKAQHLSETHPHTARDPPPRAPREADRSAYLGPLPFHEHVPKAETPEQSKRPGALLGFTDAGITSTPFWRRILRWREQKVNLGNFLKTFYVCPRCA